MSLPEVIAMDVDTFYCDPQPITVLRSKESKIFKCRSDVLRQTCGLFADMLDLKNDTTTAPVPLDVSSRALRSFLNAIYTQNMADVTHKFAHLDEDGFELLALCDYVEAPFFKAAIMKQILPSKGDGLPWLAFAIASKSGDVGLAREALKLVGRMVQSHGGVREAVELGWMDDMYRLQITSAYAAELFRMQLSSAYRKPAVTPTAIGSPIAGRASVTSRFSPFPGPRHRSSGSATIAGRAIREFDSSDDLYGVDDLSEKPMSSRLVDCNHRYVDWVKLATAFNPK